MTDAALTAVFTLLQSSDEDSDSQEIRVYIGSKLHENYIAFGIVPDALVSLTRDPSDPDKFHVFALNECSEYNGIVYATYIRQKVVTVISL